MIKPSQDLYDFPAKRPGDFQRPIDYMFGDHIDDTPQDTLHRQAVYDLGYASLTVWQRLRLRLGMRVQVPFEVVITGDKHGWGINYYDDQAETESLEIK